MSSGPGAELLSRGLMFHGELGGIGHRTLEPQLSESRSLFPLQNSLACLLYLQHGFKFHRMEKVDQ